MTKFAFFVLWFLNLGTVASAETLGLSACEPVLKPNGQSLTITLADFKPSLLSRARFSSVNFVWKKAYGALLVHNISRLQGFDLYFRETPDWVETKSEAKTGTFVLWSMHEFQSLYVGQPTRYYAIYERSIQGKLISFSTLERKFVVENTDGQRASLFLPAPEREPVNLSEYLRVNSQNNRGWDGDLVGAAIQRGYAVTFFPDEGKSQ